MRLQDYQIGTLPPSGQSRHHWLPVVLPYPTSSLRGFFTTPTSHPDSFHSFPCSSSDFPLCCRGAALAHLYFLPLMIWYSGLITLFLFLLARAAPAYLPTALSVALKPLFPFRHAQFVFPLKPAPFCTLFAGHGSTNKSVTSLPLLSNSRSVLATQSSAPSFLLIQSL